MSRFNDIEEWTRLERATAAFAGRPGLDPHEVGRPRGSLERPRDQRARRNGRNPMGETPVVDGITRARSIGAIFSKRIRNSVASRRAVKVAAVCAACLGLVSVISHRASLPDRPTLIKLIYEVSR